MKKVNFLNLAILAVVVLLSSCKKDVETSDLILDNFKTADLTIYLSASLDLNQKEMSPAPEGTRVVISAPYSDFNPGAKGSFTDTLKVDAQGKVIAKVKTSSKGVSYTVQPIDFEYDQKQAEGLVKPTLRKILKTAAQTHKVLPNEVKILKFTYDKEELVNADNNKAIEFVNVTIYINGQFNADGDPELDHVPSPSEIKGGIQLVNNDETWSFSIEKLEDLKLKIGGNDVKYSKAVVKVPVGMDIKIKPFVANHKNASGDNEKHEFKSSTFQFQKIDGGKEFRTTLTNQLILPGNI